MAFPANVFGPYLEEETLDDKLKFIRFERLSELFTYIAIIAGIFLTFLPYQFSFQRTSLYILLSIILVFSIFWFRLLPKKYSGRNKNLISYVLTIFFVGGVVFFTRGVQSPAVFLFYLTCLAAAASMGLRVTSYITVLSAVFILLQAVFKTEELPLTQSFSLAILHVFGLFTTVSYGWFIFSEEKRAKDLHRQEHLNRIQEINRVKDEFVFIISSKLANPIITLQEYVTMAISGKVGEITEEQKDILSKTEENSKRLELLIEDLLDLSKIESGSLKLKIEDVDLGYVIGSTLSDFTLQAADKKISLLYDNPKEKIMVKADSARLHEVVANLVDNAIKYSPNESSVKVSFSKVGKFAQLNVQDTGEGIPEDEQKHLFEKFYRASNTKDKAKGSGLGLFICKQLVERQGGTIWFKSNEGLGTTFSFKIPLT